MQTLTHFSARVIYIYSAVAIDLQQSSRLIQMLGRKGDAELYRR